MLTILFLLIIIFILIDHIFLIEIVFNKKSICIFYTINNKRECFVINYKQ